MDAFSLLQSETPIFHDEEPPFTQFTAGLKARSMLLQSPKSMSQTKTKDDTATNTHTNNQKNGASNTFKIQISDSNRVKHAQGSERCEKDRTAIKTLFSDATKMAEVSINNIYIYMVCLSSIVVHCYTVSPKAHFSMVLCPSKRLLIQ
jgi:hypothetical protein